MEGTHFSLGSFITMKNKTTFHRVNKTDNYSVISNDLITSKEISPEEKTILFHLLSLPNDWKLYKSNLEKHYNGNITKGKFDTAWKGLIEKGYLIGKKVKGENGKFNSWEYEVHEVPVTDIPKTEESEIGVVENSTPHNQTDKQNTNKQNTNLQSTKEQSNIINNTSTILGNIEKKKKNWTDKEIQLELSFEYFNKIFKDTGINWKNEISSIPFENFIQKYIALTSKTGDDFQLRYNLNTYYNLTGLDNPQPPRRG